jgi:hypothetical protein
MANIAFAILFFVTAVPLVIWGCWLTYRGIKYEMTYDLPGDDTTHRTERLGGYN